MKNSASEKQIHAAWAAVKEVERLLASIRARTEAPKLLWRKRHAEYETLKAELKSESFDPSEPHAQKALDLHAERVTKIQAFEALFEHGQKSPLPIDFGPDGQPLFEAICTLQKLIWQMAEPYELAFEKLRSHGVFALSPVSYNPAAGATRLVNWSRNFPIEGAQTLVSLAKEILTRKVPAMPSDFGKVDRPLTYAERTMLDSRSTPVAAAA